MSKKIISLLLVCVMAVSALSLVSCSGKKVMEIEDTKISASVYEVEFFMTRMKGLLQNYGYNVTSPVWWGTIMNSQGLTVDEYYKTRTLREVSQYLIAQYLFDEAGLELSRTETGEIDDAIDVLVELAGSKNNLNSILSEYGVNVNILRDIYIGELKMDKVKEHYFGSDGLKAEGGEARKQEFLEENYACFKQVFIAAYYYETETDKFGDTIYYTDEKANKIAYDTKNGVTRTDVYDSGKLEADKFGDTVYYTDEGGGKIAYDTTGYPKYKLDDKGNKIVKYHTSEKIDEIGKWADELAKGNKTPEEFEQMIDKYSEGEDGHSKVYLRIEPGYYEAQSSYSAYLDEIAKLTSEMEFGECRVVDSGAGFHIIYKAEHDNAAYGDEKYKDIFAGFDGEFVNMLFEELCKNYEDRISIDDEVLKGIPDMKDVAANLLY